MVIGALFRRKQPSSTIESLYGAIVAQARQPAFYADLGVPDTLEGRFDLILLHLILLNRRLRAEGVAEQPLAQSLFDRFCRDMDHNLRELGVGDLAVPRKMRAFGEAFYGRTAAYNRALDADDQQALCSALKRNVFQREETEEHQGAGKLGEYVRRSLDVLNGQQTAAITAGQVRFPPLTEIARPGEGDQP